VLDYQWEFPFLVTDGKSLRKYSPNPDFMLLPLCRRNTASLSERKGFCPILLGEVVLNPDESDRFRMLLQLAICCRVNGLATKADSSPLVIQAIYLSKDYQAECYLAYADTTVRCYCV